MSSGSPLAGTALTGASSAAIAGLFRDFYGHGRATATTYVNGNVVVCLLDDILTTAESGLVAGGRAAGVLDGRAAFQTATQDEFTAGIENLVRRRVVTFLSANHTSSGVACELLLLEPLAAAPGPQAAS